MRLLLVDDEEEFVTTLAERLAIRGFESDWATNAKDAEKLIETRHYDLALLDMKMPEMDGLEALRIMKQKNPDLHVIFLTGHATVEKGIEAMKLGAMDLIEKPADLATIVERINLAKAEKIILVGKKDEERIRNILS